MEIYQGILLGILQGITEFLPVSSSGHLVLGQHFFNLTEPMLSFDISVHLGTLAAIVIVFFKDIKKICTSILKPTSQKSDIRLLLLIVTGCILSRVGAELVILLFKLNENMETVATNTKVSSAKPAKKVFELGEKTNETI